jgi:hypothetical protein
MSPFGLAWGEKTVRVEGGKHWALWALAKKIGSFGFFRCGGCGAAGLLDLPPFGVAD